jgi:hypothetical protein
MVRGDRFQMGLKWTIFLGLLSLLLWLGIVFVQGIFQNRAVNQARRLGYVTASEPWSKTAAKTHLPPWLIDALRETIGPGNSSHFDRVTRVRFYKNTTTDEKLKCVSRLRTLEAADLRGTSINGEGFRHFHGLPRLRELNCTETQVADENLPLLSGIRNLEKLFVSRSRITDVGLLHLQDLENLKLLRIAHNQITNDGLIHLEPLKKLEYLDLQGTQVTDEGLKTLERYTTLRRIILYNTAVTEEAAAELRKKLPGCYVNHKGY